jgi:hypothetical protein
MKERLGPLFLSFFLGGGLGLCCKQAFSWNASFGGSLWLLSFALCAP